MHTCLRLNMNYLSPRCAAEESKLQALEYRDIRLKPKLAKVCSEEHAVYCKVSNAVGSSSPTNLAGFSGLTAKQGC